MTVDQAYKDPENPDQPEIKLTEHDKELVRAARFGMEIEGFMESTAGAYLLGLAGEMEASCDAQLRYVDPTNLKVIVDLQVRARAAAFLKEWLLAAVQTGLAAVQQANDSAE